MSNKPRLGRGLDALIGGDAGSGTATLAGELSLVPVGRIEANPYQPRKAFDGEELKSLTDSIRNHGVLQPLVVRRVGDGFQLVAGERRLRASKDAGLAEVPVRVVDFDDQKVIEAALVENIQRTDLNPLEKAQGFAEYLDRYKMTEEQLAGRLGLGRTTVSNLLGLLKLAPEVQQLVRGGEVSLGHAKCIKGVPDHPRQVFLAREVVLKKMSVRELEAVIREQPAEAPAQTAAPEDGAAQKPAAPEKTSHVQGIEDELRQKLAVRVAIKLVTKEKGQFVIGFDSNDDFERVVSVLRA